MIVDLHEFPNDDSFAICRRFKLGNVVITIEVTSGHSAMANDDIKNFRRVVSAIESLDAVS